MKLPSYSFGFLQSIQKSDGSTKLPTIPTQTGVMPLCPLNTISTYNLQFSPRNNIFYTSF
ncbi:MAG: hypothetical protein C0514_01285 [Candidatus Puniceispirillum sp.]|nr:hypothetical protein [Candidatus Puniceispirillum sp.]